MTDPNGKRYGQWAGNPKGYAEDKARCVAKVFSGPWPISSQCARKRGHGPQGLFCKQHGVIESKRAGIKTEADR